MNKDSKSEAEVPDELAVMRDEHRRHAERMESVGLLAGGIAHDFNNVLSGILGFTSYLMSKTEPGTNLYRDLSMIEQSALRGAELTRQLVAFARRRHFPKEPVSLNAVIEEVFDVLEGSLPHHIVVHRTLSPELPDVAGDRDQLRQVVMNLCQRATDSMAADGGTLTVTTECRRLNERERAILVTVEDVEYVCMTVRDTGRAIAADERAHIFDPFYSSKSSREASALGLSIAYGIVSNHHGDVVIESGEGPGATFNVYLPVLAAKPQHVEADANRTLEGTETVLVIDDESIVRQMVVEVLKGRGYKVVSAASGEEGVELLREIKDRVSLVFLDLVMPGMGGEATFRAVRNIKAEVPILLTSGFAQEELSERLIKAGAAGLVFKPYKSEDLLIQIREVLDRKTREGGA
ncbi:MAG TPA: response regulator [Kiritimatiellia bacterium]|nr:response regulator [Kiritimatiellia bacterium]